MSRRRLRPGTEWFVERKPSRTRLTQIRSRDRHVQPVPNSVLRKVSTMRRFSFPLPPFIFAFGMLTSCLDAELDPPLVEFRDSAGVSIVQSLEPLWPDEGGGWSLDSVPSLIIDADPEDLSYYLGSPVDPRILMDGRIVVPDRMNAELLFFDSLGSLLSRVGRQGEGPGEFLRVHGVHSCGEDTLVVQEGPRVTLLDSSGRFIRTERVSGKLTEGGGNLEGVFPDCSALLLVDNQYTAPTPGEGIHQIPTTLHWASLDGSARDTVRRFGGRDVFPVRAGDQVMSSTLPFGRTPVWVTVRDEVYFGDGGTPEILRLDRSGSVGRIVRWESAPIPVTHADWGRYDRERLEYIQEYPREAPFKPESSEIPGPRSKPVYSGLLADDQGNLWVRQYGPNDHPFVDTRSPDAWWVFDDDGRWLGGIHTPARFELSGVVKGRAIGVFRDEDDLPHIWVLQIRREGP